MKLSLIVITENDYGYRTRSDDKCDKKSWRVSLGGKRKPLRGTSNPLRDKTTRIQKSPDSGPIRVRLSRSLPQQGTDKSIIATDKSWAAKMIFIAAKIQDRGNSLTCAGRKKDELYQLPYVGFPKSGLMYEPVMGEGRELRLLFSETPRYRVPGPPSLRLCLWMFL